MSKHRGKCFQWKQELRLIKLMEHAVHCNVDRYYWTARKPIPEIGLKWLHCPSRAVSVLSSCSPFPFCPQTHTQTHTLFMKIFVPRLALMLTFHVLLSPLWQHPSTEKKEKKRYWRVCCGFHWAEPLRESCCFSFYPIFLGHLGPFGLGQFCLSFFPIAENSQQATMKSRFDIY